MISEILDEATFDEVMFMKDLLKQLIERRISPDDLVRESEILKSYFMSFGLWLKGMGVENNNMHVSNL